ncbi:MAG: hypothetical protein KME15_13470 [Drouetiella hepatica Uher 2000/2452]|jgi:hypothetical protein|uniref:Uncharacterized protein n=1 Tax=Drouetiella hepatica Uher 2000/2452 TaxID=904376 RepID=A0A951QC09_9CYAN|nr:hypothetical protein [Drouetiella hepatica Uher 2000/2452]
MSLSDAQVATQSRNNARSSNEPTDENILVAAASQFSKLVQVHKLSASQTGISADDLARVDTVKKEAIAKIIVLLTAYYKTQGWNPQDIKASALSMLDRG